MKKKLTFKQLRERLFWEQKDMAAYFEVSVTTIRNWEHGRNRMSLPHKAALTRLIGSAHEGIVWPKEGE